MSWNPKVLVGRLKSAFIGKREKSKEKLKENEPTKSDDKTKKENEKEKKVIEEQERSREASKKKKKKARFGMIEDSMELVVELPPLPEDMICTIFAHLDVRDLLLGVALSCKHWHQLVSSGRIFLMDEWFNKTNVSKNSKFRSEGRSYFDKKLWAASIESFTKAIILNPRDHLAYFWRAYAFDESCKYELAVKDFTKSLLLEPDDATAYSNRGATYRDMGDPDKAIKDLQKALKLDPSSAPVHNNLGVVFGDLGRYEEALEEYQKALEIDPQHVVALRNRGRRLEKMGRIAEAFADFEQVLKLDPADAVALRFFESPGAKQHQIRRDQQKEMQNSQPRVVPAN